MNGAGVLRRGGGWGVKNLSQLMLEVASCTIVHSTTIIVLVLLLLVVVVVV